MTGIDIVSKVCTIFFTAHVIAVATPTFIIPFSLLIVDGHLLSIVQHHVILALARFKLGLPVAISSAFAVE
jgi:hypothetical protein